MEYSLLIFISFIAFSSVSLFLRTIYKLRIDIWKLIKGRNIYNKHLSNSLFLSFFFVFFFSAIDSNCQDKEELDMINTSVQKELPVLLEKIPIGMEDEYGFKDREEFNRVKLLNPINVLLPTSEFFSNEFIDTTNVNFSPSQYWKTPVSVDDKVCCFLLGKFIENNFKVFGIGENMSAQKLNSINENIFTYNNMQRSILMFPNLKKQYIVFYNNEITYKKAICILLDDFFDSTLLIKEQSLYETLHICKNNSEQ